MRISTALPWRSGRAARPAAGFTLIELMITVAVVAILAAVAYPGYADYVRRAKRATAQAALLDLANKQQAYLLDRRTYADTTAKLAFSVPQEIANDYQITITFDATKPLEYTLVATPSSAAQQRKGEQALTLAHTGAKSPTSYWIR
jgi:type IV pilus assembly protein PilE